MLWTYIRNSQIQSNLVICPPFLGLPEFLRRRRLQAGVPADAALQPDQVSLGEEPRRQVRLWSDLRQGLSQALA